MTKVNKEVAVASELQKAEEMFTEFELLVRGGAFSGAVSRLYYCLLHRVKALLLTEGLEPKSHAGTLRLLSDHFVKSGPLEPEDSHLFARLMKYREEADYSPSFKFTEKSVAQMKDEVDALSAKILQLIRQAGFKT